MVQIARLGMGVVRSSDVAHPSFLGKATEFIPPPIVQDINIDLVAWPIHPLGGKNRRLQHLERLVIGGNENIDSGPQGFVRWQAQGLPLERPSILNITKQ